MKFSAQKNFQEIEKLNYAKVHLISRKKLNKIF